MRRAIRRIAFCIVVAGALLAAGFVWFIAQSVRPAAAPPRAEGIVVLTGGSERIETALRLLSENQAPRLLISGVGGTAEFAELAHRAKVDPALAPRVTLGRAAGSTHGNAMETAEWVKLNNIHTLIVVTAGYHMPRALAELSRTMPQLALYPMPVQPSAWRDGVGLAGIRLLAAEYGKFLAVKAGLSRMVSRSDERSAAHGPASLSNPENRGG